ncbi:MAG: bifunctional serine/threonine-protein kinase/formylglycine-generating enzyme family protein [Planctomycetota bacterium]|nr:bifunctional serine/threonine-protein kinase/formylglycine-generating enzyme family protein [Planctomycetota bacterium]
MSQERGARVRSLFDALEELRPSMDHGERKRWLEGRCGEDLELLEEVWGLHRAADNPDTNFLNPPVILTQPEDLLGMDLHEYRLHSLLGVGGMGAVYRAYGKHGNREVAIKVLHPSFFGDPETRRRFELEVELIGKLKHPNIVRLLTAGEDGGLLWFAMDLVDGWSLGELQKLRRADEELPKGAPDISDPKVMARIVRDLADALECAHVEGVLHRDIKPGNLLIDREGKTHLADFGLARILDADPVTRTGLVGGTCSYMSPEQARQLKDAVTAHSDIYSVGAVLYELLAGKPPFGLDGSPAVLRHIAEEEVPALSKGRRGVEPALAICAQKALRLAPEERYASAQDLSQDLTRWLAGKPILARSPGLIARARSRARSRKFVAFSATGLVLIALVASGSAMWWNKRQSARADWGTITVDGSKLPAETRIQAEVLRFGTAESLMDTANSPLGGKQWSVKLPAGVVWIRVRTPGQPAREMVRSMLPHGEVGWVPETVHALPTTVSFIDVAAGTPRVMTPRMGKDPLYQDIVVQPFQIGQLPISNREFEQFLNESGRTRGEGTSKRRADLMPSSGVPDWGDLPATGMSQELALAAAEWWGCRLATRAEWEWAVSQHLSLGPDGLKILTNQDPWLLDGDNNKSTFLAYLKFAEMSQPASQLGPNEMGIANVREWTISPLLHESQGLFSWVAGRVHICGVNWQVPSSEIDLMWIRNMASTMSTLPSGDVGFRLVR